MKGERLSGLNKNITYELFDSVKVGLKRYKAIYDQYPNYTGKYFFDSIKTLLNIPDVYVYADSITKDGILIPIKKFAGKSFDYLTISNTYLGVGHKDLIIIYSTSQKILKSNTVWEKIVYMKMEVRKIL